MNESCNNRFSGRDTFPRASQKQRITWSPSEHTVWPLKMRTWWKPHVLNMRTIKSPWWLQQEERKQIMQTFRTTFHLWALNWALLGKREVCPRYCMPATCYHVHAMCYCTHATCYHVHVMQHVTACMQLRNTLLHMLLHTRAVTQPPQLLDYN